MPDKKISQFDTFTGLTGEDVFFIVSSGESSNSNAQNYKIPFNDLKSDLGLDAGGGGDVIGGDSENINFGGTTPGDNREINFQQGGENVMVIDQAGDVNIENDLHVSGNISGDVISGGAGAFGSLNASGGLIASGGIRGDVISGKTGIFSDYLSSPTGYFEEIIVSGDAHISGDFYVSGTTYVNEVVDTTISGTLSGYTGIFDMTSGANASFTNSLTISGVPVSTGAGGTVGGLPVVGGDNDNIDFGGTEPGDNREINFQQGGENVMVIDQAGDVNIENDLHVSGNISGDIISGKTGVFTESLTISGATVLTGNQQSSIQWLEDAGGGQLTIRESSFDGVNFVISKWYSSTASAGDIYYNDGQVGIGKNNPQFDLDVDGSANISDVLYVGGVQISGDSNGNLVFG